MHPSSHSPFTRLVVIGGLSLLATACSSSVAPDAKPTVLKGTTTPATTAPTSAAPATKPLSLGDTFIHRVDDPTQGPVEVTITASKYAQPTKAEFSPAEVSAGAPGDEWAALEVKVCSVKGNITVNSASWQLATSDGVRYQPQFASGGPKPEFADGSKLAAGDCLRGNIMFAVPKGTRPATAVYAPASVTEPKKWSLPAR
ncbi:DUF4352 domain-containing protein [Streptomyces sp. NPDC004787]|uniref:DUF4352 domain-containing protein n=1 Tax=Streptomyces sp. NPDC004787 TaxID=3154291 RepID=UPI0033AB90C6